MPNCENPAQIMRSWNLQGTFASGEVKYNKLVPQPWKRIDTLFLQTWREETVSNVLDWGAQNFSFYLPESLRVLSSMYLEIQLPALSGGGTYKAFPALYVIDRLRFLTVCTMIPSGSPLPCGCYVVVFERRKLNSWGHYPLPRENTVCHTDSRQTPKGVSTIVTCKRFSTYEVLHSLREALCTSGVA